jgi:hypothetical protein
LAQEYVIFYCTEDPIYVSQERRTGLDVALIRAEHISRHETEHWVEVWLEDDSVRVLLVAQFFNGEIFKRREHSPAPGMERQET